MSAAVIAPSLVVTALFIALLAGSPAEAASGRLVQATSCPTETYTGASVGDCSTTSDPPASVPVHLRSAQGPTYADGRLMWEVCGYPASATGDTIRLYISGVTQPDWTSTVRSDGCVTFSLPWCPAAGTYTLAAVDQTHSSIPEATGQVTVRAACGAATASGHLAFTGANILKIIVAAIMAIVLGYIVVRLNRQRNPR